MKIHRCLIISLVLLGLAGTAIAAKPAFKKQPNIILVITDDQGYYDLSGHGNPHLATPNLDKLRIPMTKATTICLSRT